MNAVLKSEIPTFTPDPALAAAVEASLQRLAPVWPLDRFIAVNPWWGFTHLPLPEAARHLHGLNGTVATWSSAEYRAALARGEITRESLAEALRRRGLPVDVDAFLARPDRAPAAPPRLRLSDWLESAAGEGKGLSLNAVVIHAIGQHCASWFDQGQALWRPASDEGLYAAWRRTTAHDHGLSLLTGIPGIAARLAALPEDPERLLAEACRALRPGAPERYFTALLLSVNGWAGWCAGLAWRARQQGGTDDSLRQLLAIRLAWDWVLADLAGDDMLRAAWRRTLAEDDAPLDDTPWIWQEALEIAWQAGVAAGLSRAEPVPDAARPPLEAVFCIDVRSEPLRRALEAQHPGIRTHGFAGFFGLPIDYLPPGGDSARPQLPGLLAPALRVTAIAGSEG
ncbi:MAG TPA: putative inorganic carbon transporter subunit DabA, partial [Fluviicoccus sp.]|nr:putative inorganic carbon transporter subunit DabA [Fluviicoccus sp.]